MMGAFPFSMCYYVDGERWRFPGAANPPNRGSRVQPAGNIDVTGDVHLEPSDGSVTIERILLVVGNATDDSPIVVLVRGIPVPMVGGQWFDQLVLSEGSNEIGIEASDSAGNTASETIVVVLDTLPPSLNITLEMDGRTFGSDTGTLFTKEAQAVFTLETDEDVTMDVADRTMFRMEKGSTEWTLLLDDGTNLITFVARDDGDNSAGPFLFSIVRDTIAPHATIAFPPDGHMTDRPQVLVNGVLWNGTHVVVNGCRITPRTDGTFETPLLLDIGENRISVVAVDGANNTSELIINVTRLRSRADGRGDDQGVTPHMIVGAASGLVLALVISSAFERRGRP